MKTKATLDDLVDQVGNLTSATTDLLNATNLGKVNLDSAVSEAQGHAQSAELASTSAVNAKEVAISKAAEAKTAADNATAIVHNDEGSLTSKPGAYPVADSKGHLDINWTPLLAAMYPHSGIIGNIDKNELFSFYTGQNNISSNEIEMRNPQNGFNINGRFVRIASWTRIQFPEAESTAARAIAFDDIFLDWNGNVTTYRSITPHRTTTGYDRDAIATEHGYSKIQKGLYKAGDTYALLLGRVARRNQGAYHPVYNSEGTTGFYRSRDPVEDQRKNTSVWYSSVVKENIVLSDCFNSAHVPMGVAVIGNPNSSLKLRPNKECFDAIYADDFTPLYYSAKNVIDRQALLFDSFNQAVAGETFSGAEGTLSYKKAYYIRSKSNPAVASLRWANSSDAFQVRWFELYDKGFSADLPENQSPGNPPAPADLIISQAGYVLKMGNYDEHVFVWQDPAIPEGTEFLVRTRGLTARPQFLMCDIIGSLEAMPPEFLEHGIPGNWLAVGEEGESLIPDGTQKNYKLSRKCLECYQVLSTDDKGVTWTDNSALRGHFEGASNSMSHNPSAATCYMVFYRTSANPFELADNGWLLDISNRVDVLSNSSTKYAPLCSNLINKVPVTTGFFKPNSMLVSLGSFDNDAQLGLRLREFGNEGFPKHGSLIDYLGFIAPVCKVLPVLVSNNLKIIYKELKHNGTQWGDDNKFNIVDKQSTVTDLNGESVIVGQKRVELPYQFDGITY